MLYKNVSFFGLAVHKRGVPYPKFKLFKISYKLFACNHR
jgi:hypothetical protein